MNTLAALRGDACATFTQGAGDVSCILFVLLDGVYDEGLKQAFEASA